MNLVDMSGRIVPGNDPETLASGLYWYERPEEADHVCGSLRPGFMVIDGHVINVCNGTTTTAHLPDIYLADDELKPIIQYGLLISVGILAAAIVKRVI